MDERVRELEQRLTRAEERIGRLSNLFSTVEGTEGLTLTAPVHIANAAGKVVLELSADSDGGYLHVNSVDGKMRVVLGCDPHGGWVDILHAESERLAITLTATADGGNIEVTDKEGNSLFDIR